MSQHAFDPSAAQDRRQGERLPIRFVAQVAEGAGPAIAVQVLNLSRTGFMASCHGGPHAGAAISFAAPNGETLPATVQWAREGRIGCRFATELSWEDVLGLGLDELDSEELPEPDAPPRGWKLRRRRDRA